MGNSNLVFIVERDAKRLAKVHHAIATAKTWRTFCKRMPARDLKYVKRNYIDSGDPLPRKRDGFSLPGSYFDGDWPDWPDQMMLDWMPRSIVKKYGKPTCSVLNGYFLELAMADAEDILRALEKEGFRCRLNERLVRQACGWILRQRPTCKLHRPRVQMS